MCKVVEFPTHNLSTDSTLIGGRLLRQVNSPKGSVSDRKRNPMGTMVELVEAPIKAWKRLGEDGDFPGFLDVSCNNRISFEVDWSV